jgi:regulator of nucleoside diphosphate kinase
MSKQSNFQLTTKDFSILEFILERNPTHDETFLRLLRSKLATATVVSQEDVDRQVATINSRVEYAVDDGPTENRILIHGEERTLPGLTLPVTTLRGLALLGLRAVDSIVVERPDGVREEVCLRLVAYQPEAAKRRVSIQPLLPELVERPEEWPRVVELRAHLKPPRGSPKKEVVDPFDDDPGPRAA